MINTIYIIIYENYEREDFDLDLDYIKNEVLKKHKSTQEEFKRWLDVIEN